MAIKKQWSKEVSIKESSVRESDMSHTSYRKQTRERNCNTINCKVYPLAHNEIQAAAEFTSKNEELGCIKKVNSPWGSPFFFIKKKDGSLRPVQDYWTVNSWTERDIYPMPHIEQILEQLHGKVLFMTLDI